MLFCCKPARLYSKEKGGNKGKNINRKGCGS
jgi:hypothetical protein